ncbi:hypothetical protein ASE14_02905 [Agromyces sp. Root81]|uniref:hypothetical protein n=1 Tax=Agromyces sp. Root81 TaxID=1736601 RepID=UPI00070138FC|nr:hypothetical protein [Agromyces sp. Root81]KRC62782.1 hypothetical protein ASE14_02905 [Agromyces sp. Root81]
MRWRTRTAVALSVGGVAVAGAIAIAIVVASSATTRAASDAPAGPPPDSASESGAVTVRAVDGGADYYGHFEDGLPDDPGFFPIGVWFASVTSSSDTEADRSMGVNTYVELTANSSLELIADAGMHAIPSVPEDGAAGLLVADEVDMWAGPGDGAWTGAYPGDGQVCTGDVACGYSIMAELVDGAPAGLMTVANFGKGVAFWESDVEAQRFLEFTDVVSTDAYWFTDPNICGATEGGWGPGDGEAIPDGECRIAANYGWTVEHLRSLVSPASSKPVWQFVEVGQPFGDGPVVTGAQIRSAVWSGIIHGARGVVYFNHGFGDACSTENVLRDACGDPVREEVAALNRQLADLAPALNAPFVDGLVDVDGSVDVAVKLIDDGFTIIAGATSANDGEVGFTIECGNAATATVVGEDRTIPVVDGRFSDRFPDSDTVHVYRLEGGTCDL